MVPMDYDPLLAKLIGYGTDRDQVIGRLTRALSEYFVGGIKTNISLFRRILRDADFIFCASMRRVRDMEGMRPYWHRLTSVL